QGFRSDARGGRLDLTQFRGGVVKQAARGVELPTYRGVLSPAERIDHVLPSRGVTFAKPRADLADGLRSEEQSSAGVVENRAGDFELLTRPGDDLLAGMRVQLLGVEDLHASSILRQARAVARR